MLLKEEGNWSLSILRSFLKGEATVWSTTKNLLKSKGKGMGMRSLKPLLNSGVKVRSEKQSLLSRASPLASQPPNPMAMALQARPWLPLRSSQKAVTPRRRDRLLQILRLQVSSPGPSQPLPPWLHPAPDLPKVLLGLGLISPHGFELSIRDKVALLTDAFVCSFCTCILSTSYVPGIVRGRHKCCGFVLQ